MRHKNGGVVIDCPYDDWCATCKHLRTWRNATWIKEEEDSVCDCPDALVAKLPLEGEGSYWKGEKWLNT